MSNNTPIVSKLISKESIAEDSAKVRLTMRQLIIVNVTLFVCMASVVLISILFLLPNSLRLDEAQSIWQTSHSFRGMLKVVAEDVHVPLYHILLHFWQLYFGQGVDVVRSMSLIFFVASIPMIYLLARQFTRWNWALFVTVLFSFSPFMNWYGSEARMYSLLALISIINQLFFTRILKYNKGWTGYAISAVIGAYSHYFFFFNLFAQGVFYLVNRKKFPPKSFRKLLATAILVIVAIAPWLYYFYKEGSGANTSPLLAAPSTVDFFNAFSQFAFGFQTNAVNTILVSCWPLLILFGFFAIRRNQKIPLQIQYLLFAAFVPVLTAFLISVAGKPFFLSRYMVSVIAPLTILLVWFVSHYPKKLALGVSTLLVLVTVFGFYEQVHSPATPVKEDYSQVARDVSREATPQDEVVLSAPFTIYPFQYYYNGQAQIDTLPIWNRSEEGAIPPFVASKLPGEVDQLNKNHTKIYLVLSQDQGYESKISNYYRDHFKRLSKKVYSDDLTLYVYQVGYYTVPSLQSIGLGL